MEPSSACFIGYGRLEDLVVAHAVPSQPFYVEHLTRRLPGNPLGWAEHFVSVQDFDPAGRIRYCRIQTGGYDLVANAPLDTEQALKAHGRSVRIYDEVLGYLGSRGFRVERATVAAPAGLVLMNGSADFLNPEPGDITSQQGNLSCGVPAADGVS